MPRTLLLFDIDATLLLTGGSGMKAMDNVAKKLFGNHFHWEGVNNSGGLDPVIFAEGAAVSGVAINDEHHRAFHDHYIAELEAQIAANMHVFTVLPGVHDLLAMLRRRAATQQDIAMGLVTGNYTRAVPVKLKAARIDPGWFEITAFGDEAPTRPQLVELALKKFEQRHNKRIEPRRVVVIGDTPRDVHCAKAHGCVAFAVATGHYDAKALHAAGADFVVPNLLDPTPLLRLLD